MITRAPKSIVSGKMMNVKSIGKDGVRILVTGNGLPSERTTRLMVMLGATSLMLMPDPEHTDGGKMVSPVFLIIINAYALPCLSGMGRILFLKNAYSVSLGIKETMPRT
jgi:hypothetical protein